MNKSEQVKQILHAVLLFSSNRFRNQREHVLHFEHRIRTINLRLPLTRAKPVHDLHRFIGTF